MLLADDHPIARAVRTQEPEWTPEVGMPLAVPLPLSGRAIGAVGMWFPDGAPDLGDDRRAAVLTVASQCAQALDRARLHQAEHEVADVLQRSLLPARLPPLARLAGAARYTPATEHALSGGDWYDMVQVGETTVALVVGDVVGHGPPAAAVMGQLRSVLAAQLLDGCSPASALERLDRFAARVAGSAGSTCACLLYDWSTGVLRWALAGHPSVPLVGGPGGARFLGGVDTGGSGAVLGVRGRRPYAEGSAEVAAGSSMVLYTDGLVERRGELLDTGLDRLATAAVGLAGLGPAELVAALAEATLGNAGPADDVALLVVRAVPAPLAGRLPARGESMRVLRRLVADWERAAGLPAELAEDLELALGEAGANAAEHAYPEAEGGEFEYTVARRADGDIEVTVRDHGRWRPAPVDNGHRGHGLRVIGGDRRRPADRPRSRRDPRALPDAGPGAGVTGRTGPGADGRPGRRRAGVGADRRRQARRHRRPRPRRARRDRSGAVGRGRRRRPVRRRPDRGALPEQCRGRAARGGGGARGSEAVDRRGAGIGAGAGVRADRPRDRRPTHGGGPTGAGAAPLAQGAPVVSCRAIEVALELAGERVAG